MNIIETPQQGKRLVTTVHQSRLPLCLPILRSIKQVAGIRKIVTHWGSIEIDGIFTQRHRDILDAIMAVSKRRVVADGAMRILFDPREVLTFIGSTTGKAWPDSCCRINAPTTSDGQALLLPSASCRRATAPTQKTKGASVWRWWR